VLNLVLIPVLGMNGSAIATAVSLVLFSGLQWYWVRSRIGLRPSALGF
jgi:O-antigen/teichoic acid export membrane protein